MVIRRGWYCTALGRRSMSTPFSLIGLLFALVADRETAGLSGVTDEHGSEACQELLGEKATGSRGGSYPGQPAESSRESHPHQTPGPQRGEAVDRSRTVNKSASTVTAKSSTSGHRTANCQQAIMEDGTMARERFRARFAWLAAVAFLLAPPQSVWADPQSTGGKDEPRESTEELIQSEAHKKWTQRQEAILEEARAALDETHASLTALEQDDKDLALEALARATGKLEILLAREPGLALAPIEVDAVTHDLYATVESVRAAREEAIELLEKGRVQEARLLLSGLGSEIVISVTNLPLATYPDAIKAVSPLIDQGKYEEARQALRAVLNTLVVTRSVISLPVSRASHMLQEAESLLEAKSASEEGEEVATVDPEKIDGLIQGARHQLEMAQVLGYGQEADYEKIRTQIAELEKKIDGDQGTEGIFARLQKSLEGFQSSFLD